MNEINEAEKEITEVTPPEEEAREALTSIAAADEQTEKDPEDETKKTFPESDGDFYQELIEKDLEELRLAFPEVRNITDITELENPLRYAHLRDLGLSASEAYLATSPKRQRIDTRAHLTSAVSRIAASPKSSMTRRELDSAREIFSGMSDSEIQNLYKKVTT